MKITFDLTTEDYLLYYKSYLKQNNWIYKPQAFILAILFAFLSRAYYGPGKYIINDLQLPQKLVLSLDLLFYSAFFVAIIFLIRYLNIQKVFKLIKDNPQLIGYREIDFSPNKIRIITSLTVIEYDIIAFKSVQEIKDYYYLFISKHSVVIIPKRSLNDEIVNYIKENLPQSKNNGSL
jgi:hypothetical protein